MAWKRQFQKSATWIVGSNVCQLKISKSFDIVKDKKEEQKRALAISPTIVLAAFIELWNAHFMCTMKMHFQLFCHSIDFPLVDWFKCHSRTWIKHSLHFASLNGRWNGERNIAHIFINSLHFSLFVSLSICSEQLFDWPNKQLHSPIFHQSSRSCKPIAMLIGCHSWLKCYRKSFEFP